MFANRRDIALVIGGGLVGGLTVLVVIGGLVAVAVAGDPNPAQPSQAVPYPH